MAEFQTRGSSPGGEGMFPQSRPAGLYGELPPVAAGRADDGRYPALARKPRSATVPPIRPAPGAP